MNEGWTIPNMEEDNTDAARRTEVTFSPSLFHIQGPLQMKVGCDKRFSLFVFLFVRPCDTCVFHLALLSFLRVHVGTYHCVQRRACEKKHECMLQDNETWCGICSGVTNQSLKVCTKTEFLMERLHGSRKRVRHGPSFSRHASKQGWR